MGFDFELTAALGTNPPALLCQTDGGPDVSFASRFGQSYTLLASTNLLDWVPFTNVIGNGAMLHFEDPTSPPLPQRFYRLRLP